MSRRASGWRAADLVMAIAAIAAIAACSRGGAGAPAGAPTSPSERSTQAAPVRGVTAPAPGMDLDADPHVLHVTLRAAAHTHTVVGPDGPFEVEGYAYEGQTPGPTLRLKAGDTLRVDLVNDLDVATTLHWHGADAPYEMDGVTWEKDPVAPGETFRYEFVVGRAGTFWYHPHFDTVRQVDLGLYGFLVVEEADAPAPVDAELLLAFDAWAEDADHDHAPGVAAHRHMPRGIVETWTVNGVVDPELDLPGGTRARVRMLNASNSGYLALRWPGMRLIGGDQGLAAAVAAPDAVVLGPGDRVEAEWLIGEDPFALETLPFTLNGGPTLGQAVRLATVVPDPPAAAPEPAAWPLSGAPPTPDPGRTDLTYVFQGSDRTSHWMINGERYPDVTVERVALGETVVVEVRNLSPTNHPFHMHGHAFEVLSMNGVVPPHRQLEDTIDIPVHGHARLMFEATNPGDWMVHCHILPHHHQGMMTVLRVE